MRAWTRPDIPKLPGHGEAPHLYNSSTRSLTQVDSDGQAGLYVCGITPYDATHIGHANTYVAFDTLQRVWRDAGYPVHYTQNITDVDDPLLERATATGVDWRELAASQVELFRADMAALRVIPPDDYIAVTEVIDEIADAVQLLLDQGYAYRIRVDDERSDVYFDLAAASGVGGWTLGSVSGVGAEDRQRLFAEHGGDPDRPGKRDPLDPLLWRAKRPGEPSWPSPVGRGRPGWHIECSVIALSHLGTDFTVQAGGRDLLFPHHEMSAANASAISGERFAQAFLHAGMVAYHGEKMSKSLGNLVLVSTLRETGRDPSAVRLALLAHHYRADWEWTPDDLDRAETRLAAWRAGLARRHDATRAADTLSRMRTALAVDLDTPAALAALDEAAAHGTDDPLLLTRAADALLGVRLR